MVIFIIGGCFLFIIYYNIEPQHHGSSIFFCFISCFIAIYTMSLSYNIIIMTSNEYYYKKYFRRCLFVMTTPLYNNVTDKSGLLVIRSRLLYLSLVLEHAGFKVFIIIKLLTTAVSVVSSNDFTRN